MTRVLCALALAVFLAVPAIAMDKTEVEKIIKEYIEQHPEALDKSLREYYRKKRSKQEKSQMEDSFRLRYDVPLGMAALKGSKSAPIKIVEFSDFQCPFCARSVKTLAQLERKYKGKVVFAFKHFPLEKIHPLARAASRATMAAGEQGKFWEYHDLLMARQAKWGKATKLESNFNKYARELGLNVGKFKMDYSSKKAAYNKIIDDDLALGAKLGVKGTPSFFVNGVIVRGARDAKFISGVIDRLMSEKS